MMQLRPLQRIGSPDDPDAESIVVIGAAAATTSGALFVCDRAVVQIRQYGPDGRFLEEVGRKGAGPSEYLSCDAFAVLAGDTLVVNDPSSGRMVLFGPAGAYVRSVQLRASGYLGAGTLSVDERSGNVLMLSGRPGELGPGEFERLQFTVWSSTGTPKGELPVPSRRSAGRSPCPPPTVTA